MRIETKTFADVAAVGVAFATLKSVVAGLGTPTVVGIAVANGPLGAWSVPRAVLRICNNND